MNEPNITDMASPAASAVGDAGVLRLSALRSILDAGRIATLIAGLDGVVIESNDLGDELFPPDDSVGRLRDAKMRLQVVLDQVPKQILTDPAGGVWNGEIDITGRSSSDRLQSITVFVRHDPSLPGGGFVGVLCQDVTDERQRTTELARALDHDPVTGLVNRTAALRELAATLRDAELRPTVLVVDIDHMGDVNDALGHEVGDRLLTSTAKRLTAAVRPGDTVARIGDDRFMVACPQAHDESAVAELTERVRRSLTGRLAIDHLELDVSVSIGVALFDDDIAALPADEAARELVSRADTATRAASEVGRSRTAMFDDQMRRRARARGELSTALARAVRHGDLGVEYQPLFSAVSERTEAAEALVRWNHPTRGLIDAAEFVPVAERSGVIVPIGDWVLEQACTAMRSWIDNGIVGPRFAIHVNVSHLQLTDPGFVNRVAGLVESNRLRARQLVLEAREATLLGGDTERIVRSVMALRRFGVRLAIDNFGTGSNALSLLTEIGADVLKLDGGLALPTGSSEADNRVVRSLVSIAHALEMEVVAERVSTFEQLLRLRAAGCDLVQGHLVGRPGTAEALPTVMDR